LTRTERPEGPAKFMKKLCTVSRIKGGIVANKGIVDSCVATDQAIR